MTRDEFMEAIKKEVNNVLSQQRDVILDSLLADELADILEEKFRKEGLLN